MDREDSDDTRPGGLRLAPLGAGDQERGRGWPAPPAVLAWWGSRSRAEAEIALAAASPSAICRILQVHDRPIGYAHAIDAVLLDGGSSASAESGAWECTIFIASEIDRGRGVGTAALRLLAAEVFSATLAVACRLRVPVSREPAVRAIEAAGFRWQRIEQDASLGSVWLMRCERPRR